MATTVSVEVGTNQRDIVIQSLEEEKHQDPASATAGHQRQRVLRAYELRASSPQAAQLWIGKLLLSRAILNLSFSVTSGALNTLPAIPHSLPLNVQEAIATVLRASPGCPMSSISSVPAPDVLANAKYLIASTFKRDLTPLTSAPSLQPVSIPLPTSSSSTSVSSFPEVSSGHSQSDVPNKSKRPLPPLPPRKGSEAIPPRPVPDLSSSLHDGTPSRPSPLGAVPDRVQGKSGSQGSDEGSEVEMNDEASMLALGSGKSTRGVTVVKTDDGEEFGYAASDLSSDDEQDDGQVLPIPLDTNDPSIRRGDHVEAGGVESRSNISFGDDKPIPLVVINQGVSSINRNRTIAPDLPPRKGTVSYTVSSSTQSTSKSELKDTALPTTTLASTCSPSPPASSTATTSLPSPIEITSSMIADFSSSVPFPSLPIPDQRIAETVLRSILSDASQVNPESLSARTSSILNQSSPSQSGDQGRPKWGMSLGGNDDEEGEIRLEGHMDKLRPHTTIMRIYQTRYVVLTVMSLRYYKLHADFLSSSEPSGRISCASIQRIGNPSSSGSTNSNQPSDRFTLVCSDREFEFRVSDVHAKNRWVKAIQSVIDIWNLVNSRLSEWKHRYALHSPIGTPNHLPQNASNDSLSHQLHPDESKRVRQVSTSTSTGCDSADISSDGCGRQGDTRDGDQNPTGTKENVPASKNTTQTASNVVMEGWLEKKGEGFSLRPWRKRFFILLQDKLVYFKSAPDLGSVSGNTRQMKVIMMTLGALGCINMSDITLVRMEQGDKIAKDHQGRYFTIHVANRIYELVAASSIQAQEWVRAVQIASHTVLRNRIDRGGGGTFRPRGDRNSLLDGSDAAITTTSAPTPFEAFLSVATKSTSTRDLNTMINERKAKCGDLDIHPPSTSTSSSSSSPSLLSPNQIDGVENESFPRTDSNGNSTGASISARTASSRVRDSVTPRSRRDPCSVEVLSTGELSREVDQLTFSLQVCISRPPDSSTTLLPPPCFAVMYVYTLPPSQAAPSRPATAHFESPYPVPPYSAVPLGLGLAPTSEVSIRPCIFVSLLTKVFSCNISSVYALINFILSSCNSVYNACVVFRVAEV